MWEEEEDCRAGWRASGGGRKGHSRFGHHKMFSEGNSPPLPSLVAFFSLERPSR